jgi:iron complex outermembrane receptor protein
VFKDRVKDRYIFAFPPAVSAPSFVNMGSYEVTGSELTWAQSLGQSWQWFAGWTHLNSSKADLPYAPENSLTAGVNWQQGAWRVSADAQHQSAMVVLGQARNGSPNLTQVPSFTVANLRMGYKLPQLGQRGEVFAAVENMFDKTYAFREGYPMPGRALQLGVKASF